MKTMSNSMQSMEKRNMMNPTGKRRIVIGAAIVAAAAVGWYLFRPELLFVDTTVNESLPIAGADTNSAAATDARTLARGMFHNGAHETKGTAAIHQLADGKRILRLTGFATSNGPDVHVYLVKVGDATDNDAVKSAGYVDLGALKGNVGDQNYEIPTSVDLARHRAVTIWCARFGVNFGTAPLN